MPTRAAGGRVLQPPARGITRAPASGARGWFVVLVAAALAAAGAGVVLALSYRGALAPQVSNMSGDPAYEYLGDGIAGLAAYHAVMDELRGTTDRMRGEVMRHEARTERE